MPALTGGDRSCRGLRRTGCRPRATCRHHLHPRARARARIQGRRRGRSVGAMDMGGPRGNCGSAQPVCTGQTLDRAMISSHETAHTQGVQAPAVAVGAAAHWGAGTVATRAAAACAALAAGAVDCGPYERCYIRCNAAEHGPVAVRQSTALASFLAPLHFLRWFGWERTREWERREPEDWVLRGRYYTFAGRRSC